MSPKTAISTLVIALGCASTSCIDQECEVTDLELVITDFSDDDPVPANLEYCDAEGGPCVGAAGAISFLPELLLVDSPTEQDLHGAATGHWDHNDYFAVGDAGTVLVARGGYAGWQVEEVETDADLWAVATRYNTPVVVAVGDGVSVWSEDGGSSWQVSELPAGVAINHLVRTTGDRILGGGLDGSLWITSDGQDWDAADSPTSAPITAMYDPWASPMIADANGKVFEQDPDGNWAQLDIPGNAPVVSFTGHAMVWALRNDGTLAYRFADQDWERSEYVPQDGALVAAGEYDGVYYDEYYDAYYFYEYGWVQSMCVVDSDGAVHSNSAWLEPVFECVI